MTQWWSERSQREKVLLAVMALLAVPILAWLLVITPLQSVEENAREDYLAALDRNGRVRAMLDADGQETATYSGALSSLVGETASQRGFTLTTNIADGPGRVRLSIAQASATAALGWLRELEAQGASIETLQLTPNAQGGIALSATLSGGGE